MSERSNSIKNIYKTLGQRGDYAATSAALREWANEDDNRVISFEDQTEYRPPEIIATDNPRVRRGPRPWPLRIRRSEPKPTPSEPVRRLALAPETRFKAVESVAPPLQLAPPVVFQPIQSPGPALPPSIPGITPTEPVFEGPPPNPNPGPPTPGPAPSEIWDNDNINVQLHAIAPPEVWKEAKKLAKEAHDYTLRRVIAQRLNTPQLRSTYRHYLQDQNQIRHGWLLPPGNVYPPIVLQNP